MTQTELLVAWWQYALAEPRQRYDLLKAGTIERIRKEPYPRAWLKAVRYQFNTDHIDRHRYPLAPRCFLHEEYDTEGTYLVRHHIIPLKNWGTNRRLNIVTLCSRCHAYLHPWLWRTSDIPPVINKADYLLPTDSDNAIL